MKKSDFIDLLSNNLNNYSEIDISISADLIQKAIIDSLKKRHRIEIRGFGSFANRNYKAYEGRNPKTGIEAPIIARTVVTFKPSQIMKDKINKGNQKS